MDASAVVDTNVAKLEWLKLVETYKSLNCEVSIMSGVHGLPDMVFTANAGWIIIDRRVIVSKFRNKERSGEEKYFKKLFLDRGYSVEQLDVPFEGVAEAFFWRDKIFSGFGFRADPSVPAILEDYLKREVIPLRLINPSFYHLDMCLAVPREDLIVYYPQAFDSISLRTISGLGVERLEVTQEDAENFGCNFITLGNTIVMGKGTRKLKTDLMKRGFIVIELDMSEFKKAGGGVRCLTFKL